MRIRFGNDQRFKVQGIEIFRGQKDYAGIFGNKLARGGDEHVIELPGVGAVFRQHVLSIYDGLTIGFDRTIDFRFRGQRKPVKFFGRDEPQVGSLFARPVKQERGIQAARDLLRLEIPRRERKTGGARPKPSANVLARLNSATCRASCKRW